MYHLSRWVHLEAWAVFGGDAWFGGPRDGAVPRATATPSPSGADYQTTRIGSKSRIARSALTSLAPTVAAVE